MTAVKRWWQRRYRFTRAELNSAQWPHPRPASDPRVLMLHLSLVWTSVVQVWRGPAPTSVQSKADFDTAALWSFAVLAVVSSALVINAAFCRSQYWSFVTEAAGCIGFAVMFALYLWAQSSTNPQWWATNAGGWAAGLLVGNLIRAAVLAGRFW